MALIRDCILCHEKTPEKLLVDEYDEVYCQDCWDMLPEDEKENSTTHPFTDDMS